MEKLRKQMLKIIKHDFTKEILTKSNMRETHNNQIERWAHFVKNNPTKWKKEHTQFINALFDKHEQFTKRILKQPNGKEKLEKLYN